MKQQPIKKFEVPYLCGYSKDGKKIYFDKRLNAKFKLKDGRVIDGTKYLMIHEKAEKHIEDTKGLSYMGAHEQATGLERKAVEADGIPWNEYQNHMLNEVKRLTKLDAPVPKDIDLKPERDEGDVKMEEKVHELQKGLNGDWRKDLKLNWVKNKDRSGRDYHTVEVSHPSFQEKTPSGENAKIASVNFYPHQNGWVAASYVHPKYRRQGIATSLYALAEQKFNMKLRPSESQTTEAQALWAQPKRPFGKSEGMDSLKKASNKLAELISEHRRLVHVLKHGVRPELALETAIQTKELAGYDHAAELKKNWDLDRLREARRFDSDVDSIHPNDSIPVHQKDQSEGPLVKTIETPHELATAYASTAPEAPAEHFDRVQTKKMANGLYHHVMKLKPDTGYQIRAGDQFMAAPHPTERAPYYNHVISASPDPHAPGLAQIEGQPDVDSEFEVWGSKVHPDHIGKGLGRLAYLATIGHHGRVKSGHSVSIAANEAWGKLAGSSQGSLHVTHEKDAEDERHHALLTNPKKLHELLYGNDLKKNFVPEGYCKPIPKPLAKADTKTPGTYDSDQFLAPQTDFSGDSYNSAPKAPPAGILDANKHAAEGWEGYNTDVYHGLDTSKSLAEHPGTITPNIIFAEHPSEPGKIKAVLKSSPPVHIFGIGHNSSFDDPKFGPPHREATYHRVANEVFGLGKYVPRTAVFRHPGTGKPWSAQQYVEDAEPFEDVGEFNKHEQTGDLHKMAIMNMILGNNDRHANNVMVDKKSNPVLIDNGLAFDYNHRLKERLPAYAANIMNKPLPEHVKQWLWSLDVNKLAHALHVSGAPQSVVLTAAKRLGATRRWANLLQHGHHLYGPEAMKRADESLHGLVSFIKAHQPHLTPDEENRKIADAHDQVIGGAKLAYDIAQGKGGSATQKAGQTTQKMATVPARRKQ